MKCTAKNVSVMGKNNPLPRSPSLLISCFLVNSVSLILKKSRGLYFTNTDAAAGKVVAAISSSLCLCQGRIWHQKPRGLLDCFTNALEIESPYCIHRRKITKVGNFPFINLSDELENQSNCKWEILLSVLIFLKCFTPCVLGSRFIHSSW